jgi:hypothetical protein
MKLPKVSSIHQPAITIDKLKHPVLLQLQTGDKKKVVSKKNFQQGKLMERK